MSDVGFAGTNSLQPISLDCCGEAQRKVDGVYRTFTDDLYTNLEVQDRKDPKKWMVLYQWTFENWETFPDLIQSNWFSCTFSKARFVNQFFVAKADKDNRFYILNDEFVSRGIKDGAVAEKTKIKNVETLVELLKTRFGLVVETSDSLGRYLS